MNETPADPLRNTAVDPEPPVIPQSVVVAARLVILVLICTILFWGQVILMPMALALLLSFVLHPVIRKLEKWRFPRVIAILLVLTGMASIFGAVAWMVAAQLTDLGEQLPSYRRNMVEKVADVRDMMRGGTIERLQTTVDEVVDEVEEEENRQDAANPQRRQSRAREEQDPISVKIVPENELFGLDLSGTVFPALNPIATFGLVLILSIFVLLKREDLRNRAVSFAGRERLVSTTRALNEAGERISRFLVAQFTMNACYGIAAGLGLYFLGVPYAVLWGLCTAILRYIPYVGPWIGAIMPIAVSLITSSGWQGPLGVIGLFVVLELVSNNIAEPLLYGRSVGISEVAILISAVGWAWLWGPVGLILATPLSICLVVLGQHVKGLRFFSRLMSGDEALNTELQFYHRLVCKDRDEALEIAEKVFDKEGWKSTVDGLLLPALAYASQDYHSRFLSEEETDFIAKVVDDFTLKFLPKRDLDESKMLILVCPPRNDLDGAAARLAALLVEMDGHCRVEVLDPMLLSSEAATKIEEADPIAVLVAALPPGDVSYLGRWSKLLRLRCPQVEILAARWELDPHKRPKSLKRYGADEDISRFEGLIDWVRTQALLRPHERSNDPADAAEDDLDGVPSPA